MSTILKALRRLEQESPPAAAASDPLRERVIAEEAAAETAGSLGRDEGLAARIDEATRTRLAIVLLVVLVLGVGIVSGWVFTQTTDPEEVAGARPIAVVSPPGQAMDRNANSTARSDSRQATAAKRDEAVNVAAGVAIQDSAQPSEDLQAEDPSVSGETPAASRTVVPIVAVAKDSDSGGSSARASLPESSRSPRVASSPGASRTAVPVRSAKEANRDPDVATAAADSRPITRKPKQSAAASAPVVAAASETKSVEPTPARPASAPVAPRTAASRPRPTASEAAPAGRAVAAAAARETREVDTRPQSSVPDIAVVKTRWHPKPDRRSAEIQLDALKGVVSLREGDAVGALVVKEISPSAVVFRHGEIEIRRRVGEAVTRP